MQRMPIALDENSQEITWLDGNIYIYIHNDYYYVFLWWFYGILMILYGFLVIQLGYTDPPQN